MAKRVDNKFAWVIKNYSSLREEFYYTPVQIGDCKWRLSVIPKLTLNDDQLCLFLKVADPESMPIGWRKYIKFRLAIVRQVSVEVEPSVVKEAYHWFDQKTIQWGFPTMIPFTKIHDKNEGFLVNDELVIVAEVDVLQVVGTSEKYEEANLSKLNAQPVGETVNVNGFQVLPSQVEFVQRIFERHPDIALEFTTKNQHLRNACMNFLLSIIMIMQSLDELCKDDVLDVDMALMNLKDLGFKVNWLQKKVDHVREKKDNEQRCLARQQEMEDNLLKLKKEEAELSADNKIFESCISCSQLLNLQDKCHCSIG